MMFSKYKCPICGAQTNLMSYIEKFKRYQGVCHTCGKFSISEYTLADADRNKLASYLYYHADYDESTESYLSNYSIHRKPEKVMDDEKCLLLEEVENWYPITFSEKIDTFLLHLYKKTKYMGHTVGVPYNSVGSACFAIPIPDVIGDNRMEQAKFFVNYLRDQTLITHQSSFDNYCLAPKGYQRVDELQRHYSNNKNVFVSMAFNDETKDTREAIRKGIIDAGYSPEFIDEIIHNHQIVPEMFRLIRECRFLILDITDPNYGAYYEAGYALGLGKEVIICCSKEVFIKKYETDEEKKYQKYLKPHFDIAQKQILVWDDHKDLTHKLSEWIKAIIG